MQQVPVYNPPVRHGPRAYRRQIRGLGPVLGVLPPALLGLLAAFLLNGNTDSTARGVFGFLAAVLAAPGLLVAGAPLTSGGALVLAVVASAVVWLLLALTATRRATRTPVAMWRDFWREYFWLAGAVWLGVVGALIGANLLLGGAFL
jgi:hypothetical protein